MAREAGAKVYFASSSPPVTYVAQRSLSIIFTELLSSHHHIYGIDLATSTELVAYKRDRKAIAASINADDVVFLTLEDLEAACAELSPRPDQCFEVGVFCGRYVTPCLKGTRRIWRRLAASQKPLRVNIMVHSRLLGTVWQHAQQYLSVQMSVFTTWSAVSNNAWAFWKYCQYRDAEDVEYRLDR